ncbi:hypothetical protein IT568_01335 [bacterium]|nr:hypothetical protein [bacterium]
MRHFFKFEFEHFLARCGFENVNVFAGCTKNTFGSKNPGELIFVAKKFN